MDGKKGELLEELTLNILKKFLTSQSSDETGSNYRDY